MSAFQQPLDIVNRALMRCGCPIMGSINDQQEGVTIVQMYDRVRRAELRRNLWVTATRTVSLRALDAASCLLNFEAWASGTTYGANYVVTYGNQTWVSLVDGNLGNVPGTAVTSGALPWDRYFGPRAANPWNDTLQNLSTSNNISYHVGEIAYFASNGTIFASLVEGNQNEPDLVDAWLATIMYSSGAVVSYNSTNYQSRVNQNFNNQPDASPTQWTSTVTNPLLSRSWVKLASASLSTLPIIYPVTAGPASDALSRNAFYKPSGFLRMAVQAPKAGANAWLGAHVGLPYSDWIEEGDFITSSAAQTTMIMRFVADVTDVAAMDDMFCEGFSARLAMEAAPTIAPKMIGECRRQYNEAMSEARIVDAIEEGPVEQDEDEYIRVRL